MLYRICITDLVFNCNLYPCETADEACLLRIEVKTETKKLTQTDKVQFRVTSFKISIVPGLWAGLVSVFSQRKESYHRTHMFEMEEKKYKLILHNTHKSKICAHISLKVVQDEEIGPHSFNGLG